MTIAPRRRFALLLAAGAVLATSARARAAETATETETETEEDAPAPPKLRQEWVGLELTPISYATSRPPADGRGDGSFEALQAGPGGNLRLFRFRKEYVYLVPVLAGLYVSSGDKTMLLHVMSEGGAIVPGTDRRLELGVGTGLGVLAMEYGTSCDGACFIGGLGWMATLVARYLVWDGRRFTAGVNLRAIIPIGAPQGEGFHGHSSMLMAGLEVGFGRP